MRDTKRRHLIDFFQAESSWSRTIRVDYPSEDLYSFIQEGKITSSNCYVQSRRSEIAIEQSILCSCAVDNLQSSHILQKRGRNNCTMSAGKLFRSVQHSLPDKKCENIEACTSKPYAEFFQRKTTVV